MTRIYQIRRCLIAEWPFDHDRHGRHSVGESNPQVPSVNAHEGHSRTCIRIDSGPEWLGLNRGARLFPWRDIGSEFRRLAEKANRLLKSD